MKQSKVALYTILSYVVIIVTVLSILGIAASVGLAVICAVQIFDVEMAASMVASVPVDVSFFIGPVGLFIYLVVAILLAFSQKLLMKARIAIRHVTDYDEFGRAKGSSYDYLSAKEKAELDKKKLQETEGILDSGTIRKITHPGSINPDKDMEELIGLQEVKKKMHEMASRMAFERQIEKEKKGKKKGKKKEDSKLSMHMCFMGPPGTGKTTCARIMAGFLYKYGYIAENKCVEVDGNFLKGAYTGQTAVRTGLIIQKAMHGVLFIDEAYALLDENGQGGGYGREAIATIVKEMEDHRDELVVILAGYENEMKELVNSNPGIFSRIKHYLWFKPYEIDELGVIFDAMAKSEGYEVSEGAMDMFKIRMADEVKGRNFGNARTVRNCLEKAIDKHAANIMDKVISRENKRVLCAEDIELGGIESSFFNF